MKKIIFISLLLNVVLCYSQQIDSQVKIDRDFQSKLMDYTKSVLPIMIDDSLAKFDLNFDYSFFDTEYKNLYKFSPTAELSFEDSGESEHTWLFTKIVAGFPRNMLGDFYLQPKFGDRFGLNLQYHHNSFWGKLPTKETLGDRMDNTIKVGSVFAMKSGEFQIDFDYKNIYNTFYGFTPGMEPSFADLNNSKYLKDNLSAYYNIFGFDIKYKLAPKRKPIYASLDVRYDNLSDNINSIFSEMQKNLNENTLDLSFRLGYNIDDYQSFELGYILNTAFAGYHAGFSSLSELTPKYSFKSKRYHLEAGITMYSYKHEDVRNGFGFSPKLLFNYNALDNLQFYFNLDSDRKLYSQKKYLAINPWSRNEIIGTSNAPFLAKLGLKGRIKEGFTYSLFTSYTYASSVLGFLANHYSPYHRAIYYANNWMTYSARLYLDKNIISAGLKLDYHSYFKDIRYMRPTVEGDVWIGFKLNKLYLGINSRYVGGMNGSLYENRDLNYFDIGIDASYKISKNISAIFDANNILNSKIYYVENYLEPGLNINLGISIKL